MSKHTIHKNIEIQSLYNGMYFLRNSPSNFSALSYACQKFFVTSSSTGKASLSPPADSTGRPGSSACSGRSGSCRYQDRTSHRSTIPADERLAELPQMSVEQAFQTFDLGCSLAVQHGKDLVQVPNHLHHSSPNYRNTNGFWE